MATDPDNRPPGIGSALLLVSAAVGVADAITALWANRGLTAGQLTPFCLTAPLLVALGLLAPAALVSGLVDRVRRVALMPAGRAVTPRARGAASPEFAVHTARLCGLVLVAGLLRAAGALAEAVPLGGEGRAPQLLGLACGGLALIVAPVLAALTRRGLRGRLAGLAPATVRRLARLAALADLLAFACMAGVVRSEGRDVLGLADLAAGTLDAGAGRPSLDGGLGAKRDRRRAENLVVITIDTLRADEAGARSMPRLEGLAATGVKLSSAFASAPWTLPSLASLMTGRSPQSHGAGKPIGPSPLDRSALDAAVPTLATVLHAAGFATRAVVTNPYLGMAYGLAQGFSAYENVTLESEAAITLAPTLGGWALERLGVTRALGDRGAVVTRRARRFLARLPGGRFFLWLHYIDPHAPYAGERRSFRGDLLAAAGARPPAAPGAARMAELRAGEIRLSAEGRERLRGAYRAAISEVDAEIGAVVDALHDAGLSATTLLVVTADHGEEFWDHGGVEHGHSLYDELIHVPLVLACPGLLPSGRVVDTVVGLDRLAATILDLLEVRPPGAEGAAGAIGACGKGIAPGFADLLGRTAAGETRPVVSENLLFAEERVALRTARYTYVRWPSGKEEVYDRRRDPRELRDLAARRSLVRALARRLDADREPASAPPVCRLRKGDDERTRRALHALGYVR